MWQALEKEKCDPCPPGHDSFHGGALALSPELGQSEQGEQDRE
jgi:hypothetical protein